MDARKAAEKARELAGEVFEVPPKNFRLEGLRAPNRARGWRVLLGHTRRIPESDVAARKAAIAMAGFLGPPSEYVRHWVEVRDSGEGDLVSIEPYVHRPDPV